MDLVSSPDADTLSVDERERAGRFHADRDRDRFVAAHAAWRQILSAYLPVAPASLDFARTASGKPYLSVPPVSLQFSGSHSGDTAAIAIAWDAEVGVDVECRDRVVRDVMEMVAICFSNDEVHQLSAFADADKAAAFLRGWTQKEAVAKARGEGLGIPLETIPVDLRATTPFVSVAGWQVIPLSPGRGAIASLAAPADRRWQVVERWWNGSLAGGSR